MSCKSLLALPLVGALVLSVTGSVLAHPCPPACSPVSACPSVCPGELPEPEPPPTRHTMTIFNGAHVEQQNFVERHGSWTSCREFRNYDVFFRDSPRVPWRYYGTYYSPRSAGEAAGILKANGNLASVRPHCA